MSRNTVNQTIKTDTLDLEVQAASHAFAQALAESPEFQAFEQAGERLSRDETAQNAIQAFQKKQQSLQMIQMLNAVSPEDQLELDRLRKTFIEQESVIAYLKAQEDLTLICQAAANVISERVGVSFTSACGPGCC